MPIVQIGFNLEQVEVLGGAVATFEGEPVDAYGSCETADRVAGRSGQQRPKGRGHSSRTRAQFEASPCLGCVMERAPMADNEHERPGYSGVGVANGVDVTSSRTGSASSDSSR